MYVPSVAICAAGKKMTSSCLTLLSAIISLSSWACSWTSMTFQMGGASQMSINVTSVYLCLIDNGHGTQIMFEMICCVQLVQRGVRLGAETRELENVILPVRLATHWIRQTSLASVSWVGQIKQISLYRCFFRPFVFESHRLQAGKRLWIRWCSSCNKNVPKRSEEFSASIL